MQSEGSARTHGQGGRARDRVRALGLRDPDGDPRRHPVLALEPLLRGDAGLSRPGLGWQNWARGRSPEVKKTQCFLTLPRED